MAFVSGYEYDIFVSYAGANDAVLEGMKHGWVTSFMSALKTGLAEEIGDSEFMTIWSQHGLSGNRPLSAQILQTARNSATLVVIFSRTYLSSPWCRQEQQEFLAAVRERIRAGSRIFVVEIDKAEKPPEFSGLPGYRFFSEDPLTGRVRTLGRAGFRAEEQLDYHDMLTDLCHDLSQELQLLKDPPDDAEKDATPEPLPDRPAVLLARVTDDLFFDRKDVERYLKQVGLAVLPENDYPLDPNAFQEAVRRDLEKSQMFVQLLSGVPFRKYPDLPQGLVRCQDELAREAGIGMMQWRAPELDLKEILDPQQRDFLNNETVYAVGIEEFKAEIAKKLRPAPKKSPASQQQQSPLVLVPKHVRDVGLADTICRMLEETFCLRYSTPNLPASRERLEKRMKRCDGVLLVYGKADVDWVEDQWYELQDSLPGRECPVAVLGIYDGPPEEKPALSFGGPGMMVLHCRDCLKEEKLQEFVDALQAGGAR
ncbi:MAG: toll/interleukin-1 receptor domain-containing protein [bacterium]|nr:toll/interleukin-1 receptor domain-containing protein [bacterium]